MDENKSRPPMLTPQAVRLITEILERGNAAEIRARKDDVVVLEVKRQVKMSVSTSG